MRFEFGTPKAAVPTGILVMRVFISLMLFVAVASSIALQAQAQSGRSEAELKLLESVNRAREKQGLPGLRWSNELAIAARKHARVMAEHGDAQHGFPGEPGMAARATQAGAKFSSLSENVCLGARVEAIAAEFLNSPMHRANILDSGTDSIGVGVVERDGQLFAVEDFSKAK
ncbi:MAG: CAP domain-containing protein [Candidatus Sulfotelmatobacter sp.]